jgi:hypothetical protein
MARDNVKKTETLPSAKTKKIAINDKEKAVVLNIVGQFDQNIGQIMQQLDAVKQQKTSQLQIMAQVSASASGEVFNFAQYLIEGENIYLEITE